MSQNVKGWVISIVIIVAAIGAVVLFNHQKEKRLASKFADLGPVANQTQTAGPYQTRGGNEQENDSFFTSGRVETLASLADPNKNATIVWVSAPWCGICHAIRSFIATSANKYADKVALKEIDFDSNPHIVSQMGLFGTPDFFTLNKEGVVVSKFGAVTQSTWEAQLQAAGQLQ